MENVKIISRSLKRKNFVFYRVVKGDANKTSRKNLFAPPPISAFLSREQAISTRLDTRLHHCRKQFQLSAKPSNHVSSSVFLEVCRATGKKEKEQYHPSISLYSTSSVSLVAIESSHGQKTEIFDLNFINGVQNIANKYRCCLQHFVYTRCIQINLWEIHILLFEGIDKIEKYVQ